MVKKLFAIVLVCTEEDVDLESPFKILLIRSDPEKTQLASVIGKKGSSVVFFEDKLRVHAKDRKMLHMWENLFAYVCELSSVRYSDSLDIIHWDSTLLHTYKEGIKCLREKTLCFLLASILSGAEIDLPKISLSPAEYENYYKERPMLHEIIYGEHLFLLHAYKEACAPNEVPYVEYFNTFYTLLSGLGNKMKEELCNVSPSCKNLFEEKASLGIAIVSPDILSEDSKKNCYEFVMHRSKPKDRSYISSYGFESHYSSSSSPEIQKHFEGYSQKVSILWDVLFRFVSEKGFSYKNGKSVLYYYPEDLSDNFEESNISLPHKVYLFLFSCMGIGIDSILPDSNLSDKEIFEISADKPILFSVANGDYAFLIEALNYRENIFPTFCVGDFHLFMSALIHLGKQFKEKLIRDAEFMKELMKHL